MGWLRLSLGLLISFGVVLFVLNQCELRFDSSSDRPKTEDAQVKVIDWRLLRNLDYENGVIPDQLQELDNRLVRIPGFMVPLEDEQMRSSEFLLVPSPQACIHVPPPPPNQMILVEMLDDQAVEVTWGAIWLEGRLQIVDRSHFFGEASYSIQGASIKPFER